MSTISYGEVLEAMAKPGGSLRPTGMQATVVPDPLPRRVRRKSPRLKRRRSRAKWGRQGPIWKWAADDNPIPDGIVHSVGGRLMMNPRTFREWQAAEGGGS